MFGLMNSWQQAVHQVLIIEGFFKHKIKIDPLCLLSLNPNILNEDPDLKCPLEMLPDPLPYSTTLVFHTFFPTIYSPSLI